jgi:SNF2 family DNA or RNA helicase
LPALERLSVDTDDLDYFIKYQDPSAPTSDILQSHYITAMPHQIEAAVNCLSEQYYLIGSEPGTGKTYMSLIVADWLLRHNKIERAIIFCPSSIKKQWQDETGLWISRDSLVVTGTPKKRKEIYDAADQYPILIMNYELLQRDDISHLARGALLICDEATRFKSSKTKTYRSIKKLTAVSAGCVAMTGTPVENSLTDFWNVIGILHPDLISYQYFHDNYAVTEEIKLRRRKTTVHKIVGFQNIPDFLRKISPFYIRHKKRDVKAGLPDIIRSNRFLDNTPIQDQCEKELIDIAYGYHNYKSEEAYDVMEEAHKRGIFSVLTLLRLVSDDPRLLKDSTSPAAELVDVNTDIPDDFSGPKVEELDIILEEHMGQKVIVFTQFSKMAHLLQTDHIGSLIITGEHKEDVRNERLKQFRNSPDHNLLFCTDALAYGVSLDEANVLVNFDVPWAVGKLVQRSERIDRISSTETKYIYNLISTGAEMHVWEVLSAKIQLFKDAVEGEAISDESLRDLLIKKLRPRR